MALASLPALDLGKTKPLGAELYTVRAETREDLPYVLDSIRAIGYEEVETDTSLYSRPAAELKQAISDSGLKAPSAQFDYEDLPAKLDYAAELGVKYAVCAILPESLRTSLDGFKRAAAALNAAGRQAKSRGMRLGYHNHNFEFRRFGGATGYDVLTSETDPSLVCLEMDCYWVVEAGRSPLELFESLGERIELLHLKDRKGGSAPSTELNDAAKHFAPVGMGTLDWGAILRAARASGVKHMYVEQDSGDLPPLQELKISYRYLRPLLLE